MRRLSIFSWVATAVMLAACSGGAKTIVGTGATGTGTTTTTDPVTALALSTSAPSIASDGSTSATISATAKDASNNLVQGATVAFASTAGGLAITQAITDVNGLATATLSADTATAGTNITVTASTGGVSGKVAVAVVAIQETISLTTSLPQIPSDGSQSATITAFVRNASNQFVAGATVNFVPSSGGVTITQGTTDANGKATATLTAAPQPSNRVITVTATAGSATATVPVSVFGTALKVAGPTSLSPSASGTYTITLTNSSGAGIPQQTVALSAAKGSTLSAASVVTDATGHGTVTLTAKTVSDTLTATALGLTAAQSITVSNESFLFSTPAPNSVNTPVDVKLATPQALTVTWTVSGHPVTPSQTVNFAATRGTLSAASAMTNSSGQATVMITSGTAGPAIVTASAADLVVTGATLSTTTNIEFIANAPATIAVEASPATIPTQGQSTVTATVRDAQNNLVEGQTVDFATVGDTTGGSLSVASSVTDNQGHAQTVYTASSTASATNGVKVQATVQGTNVTQAATLTVGGLTAFLSLGTGNQISEILDSNGVPVSFRQPYTVLALDAGGNPVANVPITLTIHPLYYYKGGYVVVGTAWQQTGTPASATPTPVTVCPNEDNTEPDLTVNGKSVPNPFDFNGVLDPGEDGCGPNTPWNGGANLPANGTPVGQVAPYYACNNQGNGNGKLDPGGTAVATPGSVTTGTDGSADFAVVYPESDALWVEVELIATATVSGTESTANATFVLPILAKYLTTTTSSPPGDPSPYGTATSCTNPL